MTHIDINEEDHEDPAGPPVDRPLNAYRVPISDEARALVDEITRAVDTQLGPRKRKRRLEGQITFERTVAALVCDLAVQCLINPDEGVSVGRSNVWPPPRYRSPVHNKMLAPVLDALAEKGLGYVVQTKGRQGFEPGHSRLTSLVPTQTFRDLLASRRVGLEGVGQSQFGEVIHLIGPRPARGAAELLPYEDNPETNQLRSEVTKINVHLAGSDLSVDEWHLGNDDRYPDCSRRTLIRRFTQGSFMCGGRLWNGFWQSMKKESRRRALLIDGEPAIELDYGQAGPRILYGIAAAPVPEGDLYAIPGYEKHRGGVKRAFSSMVAANRRLKRMPVEIKTQFGRGDTMAKVAAAIEAHHRPVADFFFTGIGHKVQRIESDILVDTMLSLIDLNISALPIHDAVMVPRSAAAKARDVMMDVFHKRAGVQGAVTSNLPGVL